MSKSEWASDRQGKAMIRRGLGPKINLMQSSGLRLWSGAVFIIIVLIVIFLTGRPMWQPDGNQVLATSALSNTLHSTLNFVFDFCNICFSSTKDWSQVAAEHGLDQTGAYCGNSELQLERAEVAWLFWLFLLQWLFFRFISMREQRVSGSGWIRDIMRASTHYFDLDY